MAEFYDWSVVAATNNFAPPNGAPENMDYRDVNDTIRELMAQQARWRESVRGGTTTGGSQPAYTFTAPQTLGAYAVGQIFTFIAHADSTGAVTLNVSAPGALGARNVIDSRGVQLGSGDIKQNGVYTVITTASTFRVIGHLSQASIRTLVQNTLNKAYTTTNVADAYSITTDNPITAYATGQLFAFTANFTNTTTSPTLNVDTVGAGALQDTGGAALGVGTIINGQTYLAVRTASAFRVIAGLSFNGVLPIANGGTNATTAANARTNLGVGTGDSPTFAGVNSVAIIATAQGGTEGGQIQLNAQPSGSTLSGDLLVDVASNVVRIFESGGTNKGLTIDTTICSAAIGSIILGMTSMQQFTASGTWTKPAGCKRALVVGTGGGGGGATNITGNRQGGGGGAGGTCIKFIDVSAISTVTVTVGTGGAGGASGGNVGTGGNNTTFGAHFTAGGGGGGQTANTVGAGGTATSGDINIVGGEGDGIDTNGGTSNSGPGGASFWGSGGGSVGGGAAGRNGTAFGSGGSGSSSNTGGQSGGTGKDGIVWVLEFGL